MARRTIENLEERLLKMLIKIGAKKGAEHISTLDIAKKMEISEGTIFVHFNTKQKLLDSAFELIVSRFKNQFNNFIKFAETGEKDIEKFYLVWEENVKVMLDNPDYVRFFESYLKAFGYENLYKNEEDREAFIKLIKTHCLGKIDDDKAIRTWNFTLNSSLSCGIKILNKELASTENDLRFIFNLIYGSLFYNPYLDKE